MSLLGLSRAASQSGASLALAAAVGCLPVVAALVIPAATGTAEDSPAGQVVQDVREPGASRHPEQAAVSSAR